MDEHKCQREVRAAFIFPHRSMSQLYAPRPGGRWSVRSRPRGLSAGEPSLLIWVKSGRWFNQNLTPGSQNICAASLYARDRRHAQQQRTSHQRDSKKQNTKRKPLLPITSEGQSPMEAERGIVL